MNEKSRHPERSEGSRDAESLAIPRFLHYPLRKYPALGMTVACGSLVCGCGTQLQSSLDPAGAHASSIGHLWWMYFWIMTGIYVLVVIFALLAILRRKPSESHVTP